MLNLCIYTHQKMSPYRVYTPSICRKKFGKKIHGSTDMPYFVIMHTFRQQLRAVVRHAQSEKPLAEDAIHSHPREIKGTRTRPVNAYKTSYLSSRMDNLYNNYGRLKINLTPSSARVFLQTGKFRKGQLIQQLDRTWDLVVPPGDLSLVMQAEGYQPKAWFGTLIAGQVVKLNLKLPPIEKTTQQPTPIALPSQVVLPQEALPHIQNNQTPLAAAQKPVYKQWWFWTIGGGLLAGAVAAVILSTIPSGFPGPDGVEVINGSSPP
jgi:hypothetical protein